MKKTIIIGVLSIFTMMSNAQTVKKGLIGGGCEGCELYTEM